MCAMDGSVLAAMSTMSFGKHVKTRKHRVFRARTSPFPTDMLLITITGMPAFTSMYVTAKVLGLVQLCNKLCFAVINHVNCMLHTHMSVPVTSLLDWLRIWTKDTRGSCSSKNTAYIICMDAIMNESMVRISNSIVTRELNAR